MVIKSLELALKKQMNGLKFEGIAGLMLLGEMQR